MKETHEFKTESKRLLNLMINSIYTNKEIFLRELISNASDAIDRYHLLSLTDDKLEKTNDYEIHLDINKKLRRLVITDNGVGMTRQELEDNLGTIAKSGTLEFLKEMKEKEEKDKQTVGGIDLIGQFGVGFYSAFMVSKKVQVITKSPFDEKAWKWVSSGEEDYTIEECDKTERGTEITLFIRKNEDGENYDEFLEDYNLRSLVRKYSDYVRYPITMEKETKKPKLDEKGEEIEGQFDTVIENETLNSMTPIWNKNKSEVKDEELQEFYKSTYFDYSDYLINIWTNVEGALTYKAMVFIPSKAPYNLYSEKYEKGLQLYAKGVFVMDKCKELVPDYLRFIKGLVVSPDFSLNISREILQHNRQLAKISQNLEKKVLSELEKTLKNDREKYEKFWKEFGVNIKYGIYDNFGEKKDMLKDLILFESVKSDKLLTLKEYLEAMPKDQKEIYYASAPNREAVKVSPQMDILKKKDYDVLVLKDDVDEFMIQILREYEKLEFKSINQGDLNILDDKEKEDLKSLESENKDLLESLKDILGNEVKDVRLSTRLSESPVCLVSGEGLSFEMEKVINQMPGEKDVKAEKILEINPKHELFQAIEKVYAANNDLLEDYAWVLYNQALLIEGLPVKDPVSFSDKMVRLMVYAATGKKDE
ncbi:MAG TPA: molecular chaperone HtpG [Bacillota bacterium]|nr:molecular chaperone HtpG [Bacillota bacterium]HPF42427.1 molecular chaperone HtpG [Bacillota bacterium]HPJ85440.1 molecular chaperone HtpG [Bacillota bacterium]HPQ61264.1 molecular chaperone HtpG [Bacillota bacterium]HRX91662.1 molecular chaperone HtpG [Candidatus Izemoplasmatales bacterium]